MALWISHGQYIKLKTMKRLGITMEVNFSIFFAASSNLLITGPEGWGTTGGSGGRFWTGSGGGRGCCCWACGAGKLGSGGEWFGGLFEDSVGDLRRTSPLLCELLSTGCLWPTMF